MNKLVFAFLFVFLLLPFVSGQQESDEDLYFKQGLPANYKIICEDSVFGGSCGSGTNANITIYDPDQTLLVSDGVMSRSGDIFNYTLTASQVNKAGQYTGVAKFVDGALADIVPFEFYITPSGNAANFDSKLIYVLVILMFASALFLAMGIGFDNGRWVIKTALFIASILTLIVTINIGLDFAIGDKANTMTFWILVLGIVMVTMVITGLLVYYTKAVINAIREAKREKESDDLL